MIEEWKDIEGYEGLYQVSTLGRVKSLKYWGGKRTAILSQAKRKDGYLMVGLSRDGITKSKSVHRLVAQAFIPNPNNLEMINHKDEVPDNNCVSNLEWCSRSYNQLYSIGLHPERKMLFGNNFNGVNGVNNSPFIKKGNPHKCHRKVVQKTKDGEVLMIFDNAASAGKALNVTSNNITSTCKDNESGKFKRKHSAYGYIWEYLDEQDQ